MALSHAQHRPPRLEIRPRHWKLLPLLILALPLLLFVTLPLGSLLARVQPDVLLNNMLDTAVMQAVSLSLVSSTLATLLAVLLGTPLAYLLARYQFRGRVVLETLIDLPMVLPPAVAGVALLMAFGRRGVVGGYLNDIGLDLAFTQTAVILAQLFVAAPFYVKSAIAGFSRVEHDAEQAAALDGATPWMVFRYITLPLTLPALFGGAVMTWARALGEFGATIIFAGNFPGRTQTMPLAIYIGFELELNMALTLAIILLVISFGVLLVIKGLLRQRLADAI
jgi:molybdate transport system permease protein